MRIAVAKETRMGEWRVALVPEVISALVQVGYEVWVETNAGAGASYTDADYAKAGATIVTDDLALWEQADVVLRIGPLTESVDHHYMNRLRPGAMLIGFLNPLAQVDVLQRLATRDITCWSMDCIPRLRQAQCMDALSSQTQVTGYKAALLAAETCGKLLSYDRNLGRRPVASQGPRDRCGRSRADGNCHCLPAGCRRRSVRR